MEKTIQTIPSVEKPWLQFFSEEAKQSEMMHDTIYNVLNICNKGFEENYAINYFGRRITYGKLLKDIDVAAAAYESLGVKKGDIVAINSATIPEMVVSIYALNKLGATVLTIDPRRTGSFIEKMINKSKTDILVFIDLSYPVIKKIMPNLSVKKYISISPNDSLPFPLKVANTIRSKTHIDFNENVISWKDFMKLGEGKTSYTSKYGENDVVAITFTGGTTGEPKGVQIGTDGFNAVMHSFRHCGVTYSRHDRFMNIIPAFSSYGICASMHMPLCLGLELVIIPKFDDNKVGYYIKKYRPEHTLLVPAHYEKLMNSKEMKNGYDLSFFKTAGSGGDTMNVGLETKLNNFMKEHGCKFPLSQGYGMSEVSSAASCCCNGNFRSLSVGYPLLTSTVGIFKPESTEELGYNEEGEICMTGPGVFLGYFMDDEETQKILKKHEDGKIWVHSGDVGYMDEDGFIYVKGRIKRMITRFDGHKIFPVQIEYTISKHPNVQSCAAVGVTDFEHSQGKLAYTAVLLNDGVDKEKTLKEINDLILDELEERGRPSVIEFIDDMPHTSIGKIDYAKLEKYFEDKYKK